MLHSGGKYAPSADKVEDTHTSRLQEYVCILHAGPSM